MISTFTQKQLDTSLILAYATPIYNLSNKKWYSVPGSTGVYDYTTERYDQVNNSNLEIIIKLRLDFPTASQKEYYGSVTWDKFRVIIIPAPTVTTLNAKNINYKDYNAVRKHFNLPE